jgi:crotonobetaine/carnitine-CoA ligase
MARTVPGIGEIAVVGQAHDFLSMVPVAFVIKGPGAEADNAVFEAAIIEVCKANLSDFKVPRAVYVVEEFPRATLDKIAKNVLREWADAQVKPS